VHLLGDKHEEDVLDVMSKVHKKTKLVKVKMIAMHSNAASVKSGIILKCGCKNTKTHAVARNLPENTKPNCLNTR